jgi:hypothetical protein
MKRWTGWIVVGVVALTFGAVLVIRSWSETEIPTASEYSSPWDLAHDLNDHGLGCPNPTRRPSALSRSIGVPAPVVCSVDGRPVVLDVLPPEFLKLWVRYMYPGVHYTNLQDLADVYADMRTEELRQFGIDAVLVGPNWVVEPRDKLDPLSVLSAIRAEVGGTLVVAACPTVSPSSPTDVRLVGVKPDRCPRT